ncbi:MAG TPA: ABC transporter substrate-binding protein, partial [Acidimicrobiales bacterium]|nr:ABC transporter substrate-binding protein [Acidimicrobiales bacterium]
MAKSGVGAGMSRRWRRFRRRPMGTQIGVLVVVVVVIAGAVVGIVVGTSSKSSSASQSSTAGSSSTGSFVSVNDASTSSRGVTSKTINVVFPVSNLTSLSGTLGFAGDIEFSHQTQAIDIFVNAVNQNGGINGRKINPIIANFDPTNETDMRSLCKQWTEGNPPVFAVVEGIGSWTGDDQLCVTQEGHTPFIGAWTTVTNWTNEGSPYLWWTGPDQADILATLVSWGKSSGLLGNGRKVAVVVGDRASDQTALNQYLLPFMHKAGLPTPMIQTIPAQLSESAATSAAAPLVVQRLESDGINSVIPLVPFNAMFPYLQAETQDNYFPKLLLSDYESS